MWSRTMRDCLKTTLREERPWNNGRRNRVFVFADLDDCRDAFNDYLGQPIEWDFDDADTQAPF